jgi:hypothetical protein
MGRCLSWACLHETMNAGKANIAASNFGTRIYFGFRNSDFEFRTLGSRQELLAFSAYGPVTSAFR